MPTKRAVTGARAVALLVTILFGDAAMAEDSIQHRNKAIVQESFDRWRSGTGGPFELLTPEAEWTIVGSSPLSKTYRGKKEFIDEVIGPFNARMAKPLVPTIRGLYADGDTVIILFDAAATARDGVPYYNTYTWYFQMRTRRSSKRSPSSIPGISTNSGNARRRSGDRPGGDGTAPGVRASLFMALSVT